MIARPRGQGVKGNESPRKGIDQIHRTNQQRLMHEVDPFPDRNSDATERAKRLSMVSIHASNYREEPVFSSSSRLNPTYEAEVSRSERFTRPTVRISRALRRFDGTEVEPEISDLGRRVESRTPKLYSHRFKMKITFRGVAGMNHTRIRFRPVKIRGRLSGCCSIAAKGILCHVSRC